MAISTVGFVDRIVLNVLAVPIQQEFGLSDTQVGLLTGLAFAVLNVGLGIFVARLAERKRRLSLIALGTLLWSIATALCGMVGNWVHLLFARIGVGVGEAVGLPATQSVVSDYFPPERRATAMSVLMLAAPVGALIGAAGGAWVGQTYGWRTAFYVAAAPGFILAILAYLLIAEPPRGRHDPGAGDDVPSMGAVLARIFRLRSARQLLAGSTLAAMVGFALNSFVALLLVRKFGFTLVQAGLVSGLLASFPSAISVLAGGRLADWLGRSRPAAYALVPGICLLVAAPLYIFAITRENIALLLPAITLAALFQYTYLGVTYGTFQNLFHPRMRATGGAVLGAIYGLIGQGLGPLALGMLSDGLMRAGGYDGGQALAVAMALSALLYLWAGAHYLLAARHLGADLATTRAAPLSA
ncbi:spinster family MFS transporter [Altererythrobacter sp. B11]|uniref:spinster family MFS transporter n=1 Tax=Altererythrobacter sp. B11 TaxID=2060312 RepID=UPI001559CD87|nr:MFS transporter [Altererythrobacter sp. B11]